MKFLLEIEVNAEGSTLAFFGKGTKTNGYTDAGCYRLAGPKAWGGSKNIARLEISQDDLIRCLKSEAPEVVAALLSDQPQPTQAAKDVPPEGFKSLPSGWGITSFQAAHDKSWWVYIRSPDHGDIGVLCKKQNAIDMAKELAAECTDRASNTGQGE